MKLLYIITKLIVFPGAYIRCFWEHVTARILKLMVEPTGYIRLDEACGHIEHSLAKTQFAAYLMATGPGFMNFNLGMAFFLYGYLNIEMMGITPYDNIALFIIYAVSVYLGISLLCCLFPLTEDILNYWDIAYNKDSEYRKTIGSIIGAPFAAITRAGAFLERNCVIFFLWVAFVIWRFVI